MLDSYGAKLNYEMPSLYLPYQAGTRAGIDGVGESTGFISVLLLPFFWAMSRMWIWPGRGQPEPRWREISAISAA